MTMSDAKHVTCSDKLIEDHFLTLTSAEPPGPWSIVLVLQPATVHSSTVLTAAAGY